MARNCSYHDVHEVFQLGCGCAESKVFVDPGVRAVNGTCGCKCLNCCYHALNVGADVDCPLPHCGVGPFTTNGPWAEVSGEYAGLGEGGVIWEIEDEENALLEFPARIVYCFLYLF